MSKSLTRVTVADVARAANVALGTVSRVFNNFSDVTPKVRDQVIAAAQELGYTRLRRRKGRTPTNGAAASAADTYGVICFGMEDSLVHLPIVSTAIQGIDEAIGTRGGTMTLASIPCGDRVPKFLHGNRVAGVIVKGPNQGELPPPGKSELLRQIYRIPHVWLMGRLPNTQGDHCNYDLDRVGSLVAHHLRAKGHRRVAVLNPKPGQTQFDQMKRAFVEVGRRLGCDVQLLETEPAAELRWPLPAITSEKNVNILVERWAAQPASARATALFVPSDRTAVQTYSALERIGRQVGRDVGLVSCNNEEVVIMGLNPGLTTVDVHADAIGRRAVDLLRWRIEHPNDTTPVYLLIEPTLVERNSVPKIG